MQPSQIDSRPPAASRRTRGSRSPRTLASCGVAGPPFWGPRRPSAPRPRFAARTPARIRPRRDFEGRANLLGDRFVRQALLAKFANGYGVLRRTRVSPSFLPRISIREAKVSSQPLGPISPNAVAAALRTPASLLCRVAHQPRHGLNGQRLGFAQRGSSGECTAGSRLLRSSIHA